MPLLADLDVVNAAFARIGADPLQSMDDESFGGQQAQLVYEPTVRFNIGIYQFAFSKELRQLSNVAGATPLSGFKLVYDLPSDALGLPLYVTDDATEPDRRFSRYVLVGKQAHADAAPLFAMILYRPEPYRWSPAFLQATITSLAAKFALSIASDRALAADLNAEAYGSPTDNYRGGQLGAAIRAESFSTPPRRADWSSRNPLINAWRS